MFGQKNYKQKMGDGVHSIAQNGALLTGFCNLMLACFDVEVDPASLNRLFTTRDIYLKGPDGNMDALAWHSITGYDGRIYCSQFVEGTEWPTSRNSLLKFVTTAFDGSLVTNIALVDDLENQTVIDSFDGETKLGSELGTLSAWATFDRVRPETIMTRLDVEAPPTTAEVVINQNQPEVNFSFEPLEEPTMMHVVRPGGCKKWAFGNAKKWEDMAPNGNVKEHENVLIYGFATVKLEEDQDAKYWMDALAWGDYNNNGTVKSTIGYAVADLEEGPYIETASVTETVTTEVESEPDHTEAVSLPTPTHLDPPANPEAPDWEKIYHYTPFKEPEDFRLKEPITVHEYSGQGSDRLLEVGKYTIVGTFWIEADQYARPQGTKRWFGIPLTALEPLDDFTVHHTKLTKQEQIVAVKSRTYAQLQRFNNYRKRFKL